MFKVKKGMKALVVGVGKTGASVTKLLSKKGVKVTVTDELNKSDLKEHLDSLEGFDYTAELGKHVLKTFCEQDFIVVSPGVRLDIKPLQQAEKSKIPILSEIDVASQFISEPIIAVSGTNGKTTTATLISEILQAGGKKVFLGGNNGTPLSEYPLRREKADFVIVEVGAFQLEATHSFHPHIAVLLNLAPDHMDRYGTYENYIQTTMKLRANMTQEDFLIVNLRDPKLMSSLGNTPSKVFHFTVDAFSKIAPQYAEKFQGTYLEPSSSINLKSSRWKEHSFSAIGAPLRGLHNRENMMAAALAAKLAGVHNEPIQKVLTQFKPLPHRMELVARKNQVTFINDSKGTNVYSLLRTLESFEEPVILIAGGKEKGEDYALLTRVIRRHVKNLILVGEAKERLNRTVGDFSETFLVGTFEEAVYLAYQKSRSGDVILLSPGCASQPMFKSYEDRGNYYKRIISTF